MSRRLAQAATQFLDRRSARRGFLTKTAVVGSALAVAPTSYILRPGTAYAQICSCNGSSCGCGQLCCDGYTEFCCTIYGTNGCPPGALYGGWWKVSASNFCGGRNRYYMDCHNPCDGCACGASGVCSGSCNGTSCGCALGSCGNRKAGCTHFRYGQCNQQERCLGPIICRVVTCTAPWLLEPNCTRSVRTDAATALHHRPCLEESDREPLGVVDVIEAIPGGIRVAGWAVAPDRDEPLGVRIRVNGSVVRTISAGDHRPDVGTVYPFAGDHHGFDVTVPTSSGTKQVCVDAIGRNGLNPLLGCRTVTVGRPVIAAVERIRVGNRLRVRGYAAIEGRRTPLDIEVSIDGAVVARVGADRRRPELRPVLQRAGVRHGFEIDVAVPAEVRRSRRVEVCVRAVDASGDASGRPPIPLGCRTVSPRRARVERASVGDAS